MGGVWGHADPAVGTCQHLLEVNARGLSRVIGSELVSAGSRE
jgi:hypothetical protein